MYDEAFYYEDDEEYTMEIGRNGCAWYEPGTWSKELDKTRRTD
jgi:hypothetical protein